MLINLEITCLISKKNKNKKEKKRKRINLFESTLRQSTVF